ncbi:MAG: metalloprotease [Halobacteriales archaeon]|nr:metalloprotease [Halobacteriales archaeon]
MTRITFSTRELRDLLAAWVALGLAFAFFLDRSLAVGLLRTPSGSALMALAGMVVKSLLTVGIGFLLHELAHKIVAIRFGQTAAFRADYGMLGIAIAAGLAGFLFAAPGAVHHRGHISPRENGLIALAGPIVNLVLATVFLPLVFLGGILGEIGNLGVLINVFLAAFNMLPFGPLDGRKVLDWNRLVFAAVFVPSVGLAAVMFLG